MNTINNSTIRIGNFTSSEIVALMSNPTAKAMKEGAIFGAPALTYIKECNIERRLGRSITSESNARPLTWGKITEKLNFDKLGLEYILTSTESDKHPTIDCWSGSKDGIKHDQGKTVIDLKSPITLKSFCELVDCKTIEDVRENHKDGEKYYWQLVSNAIINDCAHAELIVCMPYKSELQNIRDYCADQPTDQLYKYYWIVNAHDDELPYLPDNGYYKNVNIIRFDVSEEVKKGLTERVQLAKCLLNNFYKPE